MADRRVDACHRPAFSVRERNIPVNAFHVQKMKKSKNKKIGRPKTNPTSVHLTLVPGLLFRLDAFIASQDEELSRAEGVRRALDVALPKLTAAEPAAAKPRRPGKKSES
jgi:hypothetical protein